MKDKKLLFSVTIKDCIVSTFCGSGPGGQHKNRIQTAVRIAHPASGAVGVAQEYKSQIQNKRAAWVRLCASEKFKTWHAAEVQRRLHGIQAEEKVNEQMKPWHIRTEGKDEKGRWAELPE